LRDFCVGRRASESAAGNLIPKTDYPKTGYWVVNKLYASGHASRAQGCDGYAVSRRYEPVTPSESLSQNVTAHTPALG
jgi:hypothetical protein